MSNSQSVRQAADLVNRGRKRDYKLIKSSVLCKVSSSSRRASLISGRKSAPWQCAVPCFSSSLFYYSLIGVNNSSQWKRRKVGKTSEKVFRRRRRKSKSTIQYNEKESAGFTRVHSAQLFISWCLFSFFFSALFSFQKLLHGKSIDPAAVHNNNENLLLPSCSTTLFCANDVQKWRPRERDKLLPNSFSIDCACAVTLNKHTQKERENWAEFRINKWMTKKHWNSHFYSAESYNEINLCLHTHTQCTEAPNQ